MKIRNPRNSSSKRGFTIVEAAMAMMVMSVFGLGVLGGLLQARRATEGSIYLNTATTVAQGYIEQIKNMEFDSLDVNPLPTLLDQGTLDTLTVSPTPQFPEVGDVDTDVHNIKRIDMQNTPDEPNDDLQLSFVLYIDDLTNSGSGVGLSRRIILRYSFIDDSSGSNRRYTNTLFAIRSKVPTF